MAEEPIIPANQLLLEAAVARSLLIERFRASLERDVKKIVKVQIDDLIVDRLISRIARTLESSGDIGRAMQEVPNIVREFTPLIDQALLTGRLSVESSLQDFIVDEMKWQRTEFSKILPDTIQVRLGGEANTVRRAIKTPFTGKTLDEWMSRLSQNVQSDLTSQLNQGIARGESASQIHKRIFPKSRAIQGADSTFGRMLRDTSMVTRAGVIGSSTKAREEVYAQNTDFIKGVRIVATLDNRTSVICLYLDGQVFDVGEGPRPPFHPNCRTVTTPITKSYRELGIDRDKRVGFRATFDGSIPADINAETWLKTQPANVQNTLLGKGAAELFRKKQVNLRGLLNDQLKPLTLEQLRNKLR